jgi:hypothetical protein
MTVHPTEQWVQTDFTVLIAPSTADWAEAWVTVPPVAPIAAKPPMAKPDPRRNERRSTDFSDTFDRRLALWGRRATPLVFFLSIFIFSIASLAELPFCYVLFFVMRLHGGLGVTQPLTA